MANLGTVELTKEGRKQYNIKDYLLLMEKDDVTEINHKDYYCHGRRSECTLAHYCWLLKENGFGRWSINHTAIGIAIITCIEKNNKKFGE